MFVYLTYCTKNGKSYIGKYEGSKKDNYLGSGKLLKRAILKYGRESFIRIILQEFKDKEECRAGEKKWIGLFNAVASPNFYNIAKGGEGGDTFSGLQEEEKVVLQVKLKARKKRKSPVNQVAYLDLLDGTKGSCTVDMFYNAPYKVGAKCKGLYLTPMGIFSSLKVAKEFTGMDMNTLRKRCLENHKIVNKSTVSSSDHLLKSHDLLYLGKTFKEAGYGYLDLNTIATWETNKMLQLNIIKNGKSK